GPVRGLTGLRDLALDRGHAGRPGRARAENDDRDDDDHDRGGRTDEKRADPGYTPLADVAAAAVDQGLGPILAAWRLATGTGVRGPWPGIDDRGRDLLVLVLVRWDQ